jgi:tRNA nucleotidyltransferase (CCA-adding enzyme)
MECGFDEMREELTGRGFTIVHEKPEFLTMRVKVPGGAVQDFVCCRTEGDYDGRRPGSTQPTTLAEDLSRRDFTVNAMAVPVNEAMEPQWNELVDLFGGQEDLKTRTLRFVGDPEERITEDGLRWLRAIRFCITKDFLMTDPETREAVKERITDPLHNVSVERIREELVRCFKHDTMRTLFWLNEVPNFWLKEPLWLTATLEEK